MQEARFWKREAINDGSPGGEDARAVICELCPNRCRLAEGQMGSCGVRANSGGKMLPLGYGVVSSIALDPIEKKPLYMFHPGKSVLSIGGYGCNLRCGFCQNYEISARRDREAPMKRYSPGEIASLAERTVRQGNIGLAYTYNEPLISYEFLHDCAMLIRRAGLKNIVVTNGYINEAPLQELLGLVDAMNIDLKAFSEDFYRKAGGSAEAVKNTIAASCRRTHVEVTTLVIPGENEDDVEDIAKWLASIDAGIPLHISRFFPRYRYADREPTPRETIFRLCEAAGKHLKNVFPGNVH